MSPHHLDENQHRSYHLISVRTLGGAGRARSPVAIIGRHKALDILAVPYPALARPALARPALARPAHPTAASGCPE
jgi:hypothetical protein